MAYLEDYNLGDLSIDWGKAFSTLVEGGTRVYSDITGAREARKERTHQLRLERLRTTAPAAVSAYMPRLPGGISMSTILPIAIIAGIAIFALKK